jgi:hypothetical protein
MSSSSGTVGRRTTYPYVISSEKNTTFNRTGASAQDTPDLYRLPLSELNEAAPSGKVEKKYSFQDLNKTTENDSELDVQEEKDGGQQGDGDKDSGRSSSVELRKDSGDNDACDDSIGHV